MEVKNFIEDIMDKAIKECEGRDLSSDVLCDIFSTMLLDLQCEIKEMDQKISVLVDRLFELKKREETIIETLGSLFDTVASEVELKIGEDQ